MMTDEEHPSALDRLVDLDHRYQQRHQEGVRPRLVKGLLPGTTDKIMHCVITTTRMMTGRHQLDQPQDLTTVSEHRLLVLARIATLLLPNHRLVVHHLRRFQCLPTICQAVPLRRRIHVAASVVGEVLQHQADVTILLETILHVAVMPHRSDAEVLLTIAHQLVRATILVQAMIHAPLRLRSVLASQSMARAERMLPQCFAHRTARQPPIHELSDSIHNLETWLR